MDKKKQLEDLLDGLSPDQIEELQAILEKSSVTSRETKKKKGRGKRRRKRREAAKAREQEGEVQNQAPKDSPSTDDFLKGLRLTAAEREELEEASKSDKEMGAHEPLQNPRPSKNKVDHHVEIRCRICGKTERVSPGIVPPERDRFKCNTCCCSAG